MAPVAGRAGDRGRTRSLTLAAHVSIVLGCVLAALAGAPGSPVASSRWIALGLMSAASILMDLGVVADQTLGRRAMITLRPEAAGRLNGLFTGSFFVGGAVGSGVTGLAWVHGGWTLTCAVAAAFGLAALAWDHLGFRKLGVPR
jgi:predicted MFS family arabinose efflux permease